MPIQAEHLRDYVIQPILQKTSLYSIQAEQLLLGTCAAESAMGSCLRQIGGPALGIFQMEVPTHDDIYTNYLNYNESLKIRLLKACEYTSRPSNYALIQNLAYAALMARIKYYRCPNQLPEKDDIDAMAEYWKINYNSIMGRGTVQHFKAAYERYVSPLYRRK
jgi:hypothetical protein